MSFFKKLGQGIKNIGKKVLGVAGKVVSNIPIVGNIAKGITNLFSKKKKTQAEPSVNQGNVDTQPSFQGGFSENFRVPMNSGMPTYDIGWDMNNPRPRMRKRNYTDFY